MDLETNEGGGRFLTEFFHECRPILIHTLIVLVLEASLLLIGLVALGLETLFPEKKNYITWFETVDIWTALALLCLFACYTVIQIATRLARGIWTLWRLG